MIEIADALLNLRPGARWLVKNCTEIEWLDTEQTQPTDAEIDTEIQRLQAEQAATEYQRQRAPEYPSLQEFVDAYYWAQKGDNTLMDAYVAACDKVKADYPKP